MTDAMRCQVCGRIMVEEPAGHQAPCGRQVTWVDAPQVIYPHRWQNPERIPGRR